MLWDIFCKVVDNHGDIGVAWRLSAELAARGERVRLWVDDPSALAWMAPGGRQGVEVIHWTAHPPQLEPGDVAIEAFGCDPHQGYVAALAERTRRQGRQPAWINLEYLSAEDYVERCHGLASPVMSGPGRGLVKRFFYPGFTARTGGLLREQDLDARQGAFDRQAWLARMGLPAAAAAERLVSLFCYEPAALAGLLAQLARDPCPSRLLVAAGRPTTAVQAALGGLGPGERPSLAFLPLMPQPAYDELLWACDLNFVRGEDSLVRALWAGKPLVWQIYPQDDAAHHAKLDAFLSWYQAPALLREVHAAWNGIAGPALPAFDERDWAGAASAARQRLREQGDLVSQLMQAAAPQRWSGASIALSSQAPG